ncbi:ParB N-terminal domain-containing protein [Escherichia coli]|uniref:ParB N-terminal domain-containing protein n=1 Tax=Escherichia coli TaxID=562 RepID=UPI00301DF1BD
MPLVARHTSPSEIIILYYLTIPFGIGSKQFGWTNPVLIDEKGEIIAGHGRVMAAEMLKMDSVPVIVLSGLTD